MKGIKHLEVKRAYYNDPENTVVQWRLGWNTTWEDCTEAEPNWGRLNLEFRIKPKTITINGIEVPEPVRAQMADHQICFLPALNSHNLFVLIRWIGSEDDYLRLSRGLIHLTKEAAIQHSKALLSFTTKETTK